MLAPPQNCVVFDTDPLQHCQDQDARRCSANRYRRRRLHHPQLPPGACGECGRRADQRRRGTGAGGRRLVSFICWDFIVYQGYRIILGWAIYRSFVQDRVVSDGSVATKSFGHVFGERIKRTLADEKF